MEFKDLVHMKKQESREAFVALMQERKALIDAGESKEKSEAKLLQKYKG